MSAPASPARPTRCRGVGLVDLLVGMAMTLVVVLCAATALSAPLADSRHQSIEARVQQDLRAAIDLVVRELQRAGHWGHAADALRLTASDSPAAAASNPYAALTGAADASSLQLATSFDAWHARDENDRIDDDEAAGFRLRDQALQMQLGRGNWQAVTDRAGLVVTELELRVTEHRVDLAAYCDAAACPTLAAGCTPGLAVRLADVVIVGHARAHPEVVRRVQARLRLANDALVTVCAAS